MQVRKIVFTGVGIGVLALLGLLLIEVNSSPASGVPEDELARARAAHARMQSGGGATVQSVDVDPGARPEVRQRDEQDEPEEDRRRARPAPSPRRPTSVIDRSAVRPNIKIAGRGDDGDKNELEVRMDNVNGFYDRGNYLDAHEAALEVLKDQPRNVRMLRVAVSTSCILGEADTATEMFGRLPDKDKRDMAKRCSKYGLEFGD